MFSGRAMDPYKICCMYCHATAKMCCAVHAVEGSQDSGAYGFREICRRAHQHHRRSAHFLFARWLYIAFAHCPCPVPCVPWRQTTLCTLVSEGERRYKTRKTLKKSNQSPSALTFQDPLVICEPRGSSFSSITFVCSDVCHPSASADSWQTCFEKSRSSTRDQTCFLGPQSEVQWWMTMGRCS